MTVCAFLADSGASRPLFRNDFAHPFRFDLAERSAMPACQHIRAARVDAAVADAFLTALAPAEFDALSRARRAQQQADAALRTSAERQLERKRHAAALAERQFNRVDLDNRLVAGELERRWEAMTDLW